MGIFISQYKDPYKPTRIQWNIHSQYYHKPSKPSDPVFESLVSNSLLDDDYTWKINEALTFPGYVRVM